jgi:proteasome activator subunit 4
MLWRQQISCTFFFPFFDHLLPWIRNEIPEMIASIEPVNSGFAITDHQDPRAQYYLALRERFGKLLHKASVSLRQQGEENTVDAVHTLVR